MAFNQCMKMVPLMGRRLAAPVQVRTLFSPWRRGGTDIGALVRDMDRQMDRLERQMFRGMPSSFFPRLVPVDNAEDHTLVPRDGGQYRVAVDLAGFHPEEVRIDLDGRTLTVSAKCERVHKDGSRFAQEMSRQLTLPDTVDTSLLKSVLHHDGVLAIEAPFKAEKEPQQIPISRTGEEQPKLGESVKEESKN